VKCLNAQPRPDAAISTGSAAPEAITVVQDAQGRALTKSFMLWGGKLVKGTYPNAKEFRVWRVEVDGIKSLADVLEAVAHDVPQ
jgi:hypothetical protein